MKLFVLIALLCFPLALFAQSVEKTEDTTKTAPSSLIVDGKRLSVDGQIDKVKMYIGDVITYEMKTRYPKEMSAGTSYAGRILTASGFEIRDFKEPKEEVVDGDVIETRSFTFSTFTTGAYLIPPIPVVIKSKEGKEVKLATIPLRLDVVPVPRRPNEQDDIREIKGTFGFDKPLLWPWIAGAIVFTALVVAAFFYLLMRPSVTEEYVYTPLDAYEDAISRLRDLRKRRDSSEVDVKTYHYGFAEILRIYLERRFAFTSLSETTSELLVGLKKHGFEEKLLETVEMLLQESDLVKFARYAPSKEEIKEHDENLDAFLDKTKPEAEREVAADEELVIEEEEAVS